MRNPIRKTIGALALSTVGLGLGVAPGITGAAGANQATLGTPGTPNCVGQTTAWVAQGGTGLSGPGIGNVADQAALSVSDLKAEIQASCSMPI